MHGSRTPASGPGPGPLVVALARRVRAAAGREVGLALAWLAFAAPLAAQGLWAEYFDEPDLSAFVEGRLEPTVDFLTWGSAPTGTSVLPDNAYSERFSGLVKIDVAGAWTFTTLSNDGVRLRLDGELVIDHWDQHAATFDSATRTLAAGWHALELEHFQDGGGVALQLLFAGPGQPEVVVPASHLAVQNGLKGEYFDEPDLTQLVETRVDATIDFTTWGAAPTGTSVTPDGAWSERWTGSVLADVAGTWRFATKSNDGVRLSVAGQTLVDHWDTHATATDTASIVLPAGWHPIVLEHFQQGGAVTIQLLHAGPGEVLHIVPATHLSVVPGGTDAPPQVSAGADVLLQSPESATVLSGSAVDPDGGPIAVQWMQVDGWPAALSGADTLTPTVQGLFGVGTTTYRLVATDALGKQAFDDVTVRVASDVDGPATVRGTLATSHPLSLDLHGPTASESGTPNPFRQYRMDVAFRHLETDTLVTVPGYFAADGQAHETGATGGDLWRAHFVPELAGAWEYTVSFRTGVDVALSLDPSAGTPVAPDGASGLLLVANSFGLGQGLRADGRRAWVGEHHLRAAGTGRFALKGGADSPENLLAYADFDQTTASHAYAPHVSDWTISDPVWQGTKGKGLVGALNYLAGKGMNSVYAIAFTVDGDGDDVWPWTSKSERQRFDVSKLAQWELVLDHMETKGLGLQLVLQETENDDGPTALDGGELGVERALYLRELVARFGHHLGLVFNLGEENTNTTAQLEDAYDRLAALDGGRHPVVVHTFPDDKNAVWTPLLAGDLLEGGSLQNDLAGDTHGETLDWRAQSAGFLRRWPVTLDEFGPPSHGALPDAVDPFHDADRKQGLWGNLMAGGAGVEWYFGYDFPHDDLDCEDWRSRDLLWTQTRHALDFFEEWLPFADMQPHDELVSGASNWCLAKPGVVYALYLPSGGTTQLDLGGSTDTFDVRWFDPRNGGALQVGSVATIAGPGWRPIGSPPSASTKDWAVRVRRTNRAPSVLATAFSPQPFTGGDTLHLSAQVSDPDGLSDVASVTMHVFAPNGVYLAALPAAPLLELPGVWDCSIPFLPPLPGAWPIYAQVFDREGASAFKKIPFVGS